VSGLTVGGPLGLELGLAVLMLLVFFVGLFMPSEDKRRVGVLSAIGLVILFGLAWRAEGGTEMFRGALVQDELALFAKRLFLLATLIGVLASLPRDVTILFIEHDMNLVFRFAERITVLVEGSILVEGTPQEIAADARVREVYLGEGGHG